MNYHLMVDHWFIDTFIDDIYEIGEEANNVFLLRNTKEANKNIKNIDKVEWIGDNCNAILLLLRNRLQENDKVFVHWLDMRIGDVVVALPENIEVYSYLWGGDFFEDPLLCHKKKIYQKKTLQYVDSNEKAQLLDDLRKRNVLFVPFHEIFRLRREQVLRKQFRKKKKHIHRLKGIVLHPASTGDIHLAKEIYRYPLLLAKPGFYDLNFDLTESSAPKAKEENSSINIMVGNSAFFSGNHLDAFELLKVLPNNVEFYMPAAYGFDGYKEDVIKTGRQLFGERFHAITGFIPRAEYISFLDTMDVIFLYQNISQAFGNIVAALTLGKPVFLRKANSLFQLLTNLGIKIYDADNFVNTDVASAIEESYKAREINVQVLKKAFSKETRLAFLKETLA